MIVAAPLHPSRFLLRLSCALLLLLAAGGAWAAGQGAEPAITLEQAISQVQQQTSGKVLSANTIGTMRRGRAAFEHRIRVLTPNGHVRVISIYSDAVKPAAPAEADSTKNPASNGDGNKEKH